MMNKLYILCGIPFSGKTTLSKLIAKIKGYTRIDLDEVKVSLLGQIKEEEVTQPQWDMVYQEMYKGIETALKSGDSVIQDAGNFTKYERDLVRNIAQRLGVESITIYVDTPLEIARTRWVHNKSSKERFDINETFFQGAVDEMEIPKSDENTITYSTDQDMEQWIKDNL